MSMLLLREHITYDQANFVVETKEDQNGSKSLYMNGIFIQGGVKNFNQRVYPVAEIKKAVDEMNSIISAGDSILGECDHPQELQINLDRVSHMIEKMWMDGNNGMGRLKIIPTPHGQIIRTLIENGVRLGISSRGSGDVDGRGEVSDFSMVTCDLVAKPSGPDCYPTPVYESFNGRRSGVITDLAEAVRYDKSAQKYLNQELKSFIEKLR